MEICNAIFGILFGNKDIYTEGTYFINVGLRSPCNRTHPQGHIHPHTISVHRISFHNFNLFWCARNKINLNSSRSPSYQMIAYVLASHDLKTKHHR